MIDLTAALKRNVVRACLISAICSVVFWVLLGKGFWTPSGESVLGALLQSAPASNDRTFKLGTWKQITKPGQHGEPTMQLTKLGEGKLILSFTGAIAILVGAEEVAIELVWKVDGDYATFELVRGAPEHAYNRVFALAQKTTRFHIEAFEPDLIILKRVKDGELFEWRHEPTNR